MPNSRNASPARRSGSIGSQSTLVGRAGASTTSLVATSSQGQVAAQANPERAAAGRAAAATTRLARIPGDAQTCQAILTAVSSKRQEAANAGQGALEAFDQGLVGYFSAMLPGHLQEMRASIGSEAGSAMMSSFENRLKGQIDLLQGMLLAQKPQALIQRTRKRDQLRKAFGKGGKSS